MIKDNFGRPVLNLRLSLTQRCNFNCPYCHREGQTSDPASPPVEMTAPEITRLTQIAISLGITRIKLTGGEPLLRRDVLDIVRGIARLPGLRDLSMTTNGAFLAHVAKELRESGLRRINISLPTLQRHIYTSLMGGELSDVLEGVDAAVKAGLDPVKLNMLVLAGVNDHEIPAMMQFAAQRGTRLQLIELEPVNVTEEYYKRHHLPLEGVEDALAKRAMRVEVRQYMQSRRVYHLATGSVEVIRPIENTVFCAHCTRLRITSDGKLKPCLMVNEGLTDVLTPMRAGATDDELATLFTQVCRARVPYYQEGRTIARHRETPSRLIQH
jgi:cyclic pyranopterin phosphate synthase